MTPCSPARRSSFIIDSSQHTRYTQPIIMTHTTKKLPKSTAEITIELAPEEMRPYLERAATQLSQATTVPGFRPGKAPFDEVVRRVGAGRVWEEAATLAVPKAVSQVVEDERLETIGSPAIDVIKLAPDNPFIFKATAALLPEVTVGDYSSIKLEHKSTGVSEEHIDRVLADLRKMQTKEVVADRAAAAHDKVVLDMTMSLDTVPLEGGTTKDHAIYMAEEYYMPGLKEKLVGLKKGDTKEFQLKFPKEHYQKMIAGRDVDFKIEVKDVFELQKPPIDDAFATTLGQKTVGDMRTLIRGNLEEEAQSKEAQRQEIELLEMAIERTRFSYIPDILVNEETIKMIGELEDGIARQGLAFEDYLKKIGKTRDQLRLDFAADAIARVKTALMVRAIAKTQNITVSDAEVDAEAARLLELYKDATDEHEQIKSVGAREYLRGILRNRKVIEWLKEQAR